MEVEQQGPQAPQAGLHGHLVAAAMPREQPKVRTVIPLELDDVWRQASTLCCQCGIAGAIQNNSDHDNEQVTS